MSKLIAPAKQLEDYLGSFARLREFQPRTPYTDMDFVLEHGQPFEDRAILPEKFIKPQSQECYLNAWRHCKATPGLHYVEGYAWTHRVSIPVLHGWCIDDNNRVHDPSIANDDATSYHGVVWDDDWAAKTWKTLRQKHCIGILPNLYLLQFDFAQLPAYIRPAGIARRPGPG